MGKEHCLEIIDRCEPTEEGRKLKCLGIDGKCMDSDNNNNYNYCFFLDLDITSVALQGIRLLVKIIAFRSQNHLARAKYQITSACYVIKTAALALVYLITANTAIK